MSPAIKWDDDNILPSDIVIATECNRCGLYDYDEDIVIIDEENLCKDCAEETTNEPAN